MLGMTIIRNARQNDSDKGIWDGGDILDPNNGKVYRVRLKPIDGGKQARGARLHRHADARPHADLDPRRMTAPRDCPLKEIPMNRFNVRKVAVLGAGVMGAQIAAHLVNVKVPVVLFDLPAKEGPKNGIVTKAVEGLKKLKPAPLGVAEDAALIGQANYEEHLDQLKDCDLIIEAIAERMDWKLDLYKRIAPAIAPHAIVAQQHLGPVDHEAVGGAARRDQAALLRHPLLQPAALHGAGRADRDADDRPRDPRPARGLRHQRARQVGGARQGHAELHRQPGRHRRHAGDDEGSRELRPDATTSSTT